ncbi:twitching motility protein PilT (plasmid) [Mesorhizobium sp. 131-2-5]|uniref:type II toxin-antitoxin system VapC family toxin n=1 Tax=Mesorhizobium sp. 131-2-5 TaxID=2744519 RepID=UPI0018ED0310|nr:type II toxin-antitoxin system VapC family toxin [Mesorhizobium sp. 131-2-5]BCH04980.1 twitching motility protein PilT [Mesorhizobium sp. 131-2-5]
MPFVVDASIAACWLLPDEADARADTAYDRLDDDRAVAPGLWWFEIRNLLITSERRGRLDAAATRHALELLTGFAVAIDNACDETMLLGLARKHRLSVYDAAYLELALRERIPLATLDKQLAAAAMAERVTLVGATP